LKHNAGLPQSDDPADSRGLAGEGINDTIAAVEMTGVFIDPFQAALSVKPLRLRVTVHPCIVPHYRQAASPDLKTD